MRVLGHRGTTVAARENTLAAVEWAFANGADGVEVDARCTRDGVLVVHHDPVPAWSEIPIAEQDWAGLDGRVDRLTDVLAAARGLGQVVVEVKNMPGEPDYDAPAERTAHAVAALLDEADDVVVSSFDWLALDAVLADRPATRTAFLTPPGIALRASVDHARMKGLAQCHPHWSEALAAPEQVERAIEHGLAVYCWTVDDAAVADRLAVMGVEAVISNDVRLITR